MASISSISPKLLLMKMADLFQNQPHHTNNTEEETSTSEDLHEDIQSPKNKLNLDLGELKIISTALLQYKRALAKKGESQRVEEVHQIDQKCYDLIINLENHLARISAPAA